MRRTKLLIGLIGLFIASILYSQNTTLKLPSVAGITDYFTSAVVTDPATNKQYLYWVGMSDAFSNNGDIIVVKVGPTGDINWIKVYDLGISEMPYGATGTPKGGLFICGDNPATEGLGFILQIDSNGNIEFANSTPADLYDVTLHSNNQYYAIGSRRVGVGGVEVVVLSFDTLGNITKAWYYEELGSNNTDIGQIIREDPLTGNLIITAKSRRIGTNDIFTFAINPTSGSVVNSTIRDIPLNEVYDAVVVPDGTTSLVYYAGVTGDGLPSIVEANANSFGVNRRILIYAPGQTDNVSLWVDEITKEITVAINDVQYAQDNITLLKIDAAYNLISQSSYGNIHSNEFKPDVNNMNGNVVITALSDYYNGNLNPFFVYVGQNPSRCGEYNSVLTIVDTTGRALPFQNLNPRSLIRTSNPFNAFAYAIPYAPICICPLSADFTTTAQPYACHGDSVKFYFTGDTFGIVSYLWDFGDPAIPNSTLPNPTGIVYPSSGGRTVTLTVSDGVCEATVSKSIMIHEKPNVQFTVTDATPCEGEPVDFTNTGTSGSEWTFTWDFDVDASPNVSNDENPTGIYWTSPGAKTVILTVSSPY
ncbi:MAG: hypothetical protein GXO48_02610, partial [Chlorobi bacterium]|nr:hypothetical protein [Chlorobiota bacterium]